MDIRTRRKRSRRRTQIGTRMGIIGLVLLLLILGGMKYLKIGLFESKYVERTGASVEAGKPEIDVKLLTVNSYSRPGYKTEKIENIVIHYTANPGTTAAQNRSYFNNLATLQNAYASSHYVVGLAGEIIQCVPLDEIAYASNNRNYDTISIECCHPDSGGKYNPATYESVVKLAAALCRTYNLNPETGVIRHYDVTGKICPKYYVENEEEWYAMKLAIKNAM